MSTLRAFILVLFAALLTGCDTVYSAGRYARVPYVPARDSVLARVRGVPGIDEANCDPPTEEDGRRPILRCVYSRSRDVETSLEFTEDSTGRVAYAQYVSYLNRPLPPGVVEATLSVMRAVETRLATLRGFDGLPAAAVQACTNVRCP